MAKRAANYARVSTSNGQTPANQLTRLREVADKAGWEVVEEYVDRGISGAKGRDRRPAFDRLCTAATRREIDVVMAWSVDRLSRSLQDLVAFLSELQASGVDLYLDRQGIDIDVAKASEPVSKAALGLRLAILEQMLDRAVSTYDNMSETGILRANVKQTRAAIEAMEK